MAIKLNSKIQEERDLESLMVSHPEWLEAGFAVLSNQVPTGTGRIDILGVDKDGSLTVVELKIIEDDHMLLQGLEYMDWINRNADRIPDLDKQKVVGKIDINRTPRLILVAPSFSRTLITSSKYADGHACGITLRKFSEVPFEDNGASNYLLIFEDVQMGRIERPPSKPWTVDDYINYIEDPSLNKLCREIIERIKSLDNNIEAKPTQSGYFPLQLRGRNLARIDPYKSLFWLEYKEGANWVSKKITSASDFTDDIFEKISNAYESIKAV